MGRNNTSAGKTDKDKEKEKKNAEKNAQSALSHYHAEALPASDVTMGGDVTKVPQPSEQPLSSRYHAEALPEGLPQNR